MGAHYFLIHLFCLERKMSDACKNKLSRRKKKKKFSEKKYGSWQNTPKRQIDVAPANMWCRTLNLCSDDNGIALLPFATCLHLTRYMFTNILILYWVSTWAASIFRPHHTAMERKCSESTQHFLSQLAWHIVKDSSLIIPWQWHRPASPFRLSWTTEAGVWFLSACYVLSQIGSCPPEI